MQNTMFEIGSDPSPVESDNLRESELINDAQMGDFAGTAEVVADEPADVLADEPADVLADAVVEASPTETPKPKDNRNWFVVHTYSGYENKVKANLERRIHSMGMQDKIFRVLVPMEDEVEFKDGKRKITPKKVFPGYVLVEMIMDDQSWYVVRNTQGVTGFVEARDPARSPYPYKRKKSKRSSSRWASKRLN